MTDVRTLAIKTKLIGDAVSENTKAFQYFGVDAGYLGIDKT